MATASGAASRARQSTAFQTTARAGFAALGVIHVLIGGLAVAVAVGAGGPTDQTGALQALMGLPFGAVVVWACAIGLVALAVWAVVSAVTVSGDDAAKERAKSIGNAVAYAAVGATAFGVARGSGGGGGEQQAAGTLMGLPGGPFIVGAIGLGILGVGGYFVFKGVTKRYEKEIRMPGPPAKRGVELVGTVGYAAKGMALAVMGVLFTTAAFTQDPQQAGGLDAALTTLAGLPFGVLLLILVGIGLIAYGVYCFARAKYAKL
jgi:hypothetical protein